MYPFRHCKIALAAALATATMFSAGTSLAAGNKADYKSAKERIEAAYKTEKKACGGYSGNQKEVCEDQAEGKEKVALAETEYAYTGKPADANKIMVVKADTTYKVAKEMCDDKAGNAKDVCVTEAKAVHTKALADAKASKKVAEVRKDTAEDKRDADRKVATEKCDSLAGDAKAACLNAVKVKFNKG